VFTYQLTDIKHLQVGHIHTLRVEYTDNAIDLVVENLTLSRRNIFPDVVSIEVHNSSDFHPILRPAITDEHHHEFTLTFGGQMQADMRDVTFYIRKKTGIKMTDSGLADVAVGGEGLTASFYFLFLI
jgi:hypothetical protein